MAPRFSTDSLVHRAEVDADAPFSSPSAPAPAPSPQRNIIIFGSSGCGKSSIINMLAGREVALTSSAAMPSLFDVEKHEVYVGEKRCRFHDITGLTSRKLSKGDLLAYDCVNRLSNLVHGLKDGISLLVLCVRAPRITVTAQKNYMIFHEILCQRKIPIVVVVTGLEDEEPDMESWWFKNAESFTKHGMHFQDHACVTATKGKKTSTGYKKQEEYDISKEAIEKLITTRASVPGIRVESRQHLAGWFDMTHKALLNVFTNPIGLEESKQHLASWFDTTHKTLLSVVANPTGLETGGEGQVTSSKAPVLASPVPSYTSDSSSQAGDLYHSPGMSNDSLEKLEKDLEITSRSSPDLQDRFFSPVLSQTSSETSSDHSQSDSSSGGFSPISPTSSITSAESNIAISPTAVHTEYPFERRPQHVTELEKMATSASPKNSTVDDTVDHKGKISSTDPRTTKQEQMDLPELGSEDMPIILAIPETNIAEHLTSSSNLPALKLNPEIQKQSGTGYRSPKVQRHNRHHHQHRRR